MARLGQRMKILIVNPNTTAAMTQSIGEAAQSVAGSDTVIDATNPETGPPSIQGPEDGEAALPGLFAVFEHRLRAGHDYDAAIVACFDDTGLGTLKAHASIPVLGIGEAAFHAAMMVADRFSVVTTLAISVPVIEGNIAAYGFAARCARVRASGVPVLALEDEAFDAAASIRAEVLKALREDQCGAVVLGCAGMARLAEEFGDVYGVPVIDGVTAAVKMCETLIQLRLRPMRGEIGS